MTGLRATSRDPHAGATRSVLAIAVGAIVVLLAWLSGGVAHGVETLGLIGFDEPRSHLIAALATGAIAAAASTGVTGVRRTAPLIGLGAWAALFGSMFSDETTAALHASGLQGTFDPLGWTLSLMTFVVISAIFAWAAAALAVEVRRSLATTARRSRDGARTGSGRADAARRVAATAGVATVVAVSLGLFAQMLDFTPDIAFVRGGPPAAGLTGDGECDRCSGYRAGWLGHRPRCTGGTDPRRQRLAGPGIERRTPAARWPAAARHRGRRDTLHHAGSGRRNAPLAAARGHPPPRPRHASGAVDRRLCHDRRRLGAPAGWLRPSASPLSDRLCHSQSLWRVGQRCAPAGPAGCA